MIIHEICPYSSSCKIRYIVLGPINKVLTNGSDRRVGQRTHKCQVIVLATIIFGLFVVGHAIIISANPQLRYNPSNFVEKV